MIRFRATIAGNYCFSSPQPVAPHKGAIECRLSAGAKFENAAPSPTGRTPGTLARLARHPDSRASVKGAHMEPIEWDKAEDATLRALPNTIKAAEDKKNPDPNAKRRLLEIFCWQVNTGKIPYPELMNYLSRQFGEALESEEAAPTIAKLLLGGPAHRSPNPEKEMLDEALAVEVNRLVMQGKTELECFSRIADEFNVTEDVVSHAWRKYKQSPALKGPFKN